MAHEEGQICPIHNEPLFESHPADVENGPCAADLENEWLCASCENDLYYAPSTCIAHRLPLDACNPCLYADELVSYPAMR